MSVGPIGACEGYADGIDVDGTTEGVTEGPVEGFPDGTSEGLVDGTNVGMIVGAVGWIEGR